MNNGTVTIRGNVWDVKIATSQADIEQGFSNVESTPPKTGILFNLGRPYAGSQAVINMQQMLFPLAIVFIDSNGIIVDVAYDVEPLQDYTSPSTFSYFLEINEDEISQYPLMGGPPVVRVSDTVTITGLPSPNILGGLDFGVIIEAMLVMMIMKMMTGAMK
jgi:uncharacterized membrane protein (UPF0127 family)